MAAGQGVEEWIEIKDFTPGIFDTYGPLLPDGAAQRDGTYRCYGHPSGGLHPLPRHVATTSYDFELDDAVPDYFPTEDLARYQILATEIMSPVVDHDGPINETDPIPTPGLTQPDTLLYKFNWIYSEAGAGTGYKRRSQAVWIRYHDGAEVRTDTADNQQLSGVDSPAPHSSRWFYIYGGTALSVLDIDPGVGVWTRPVLVHADGRVVLQEWDGGFGAYVYPLYMTAHQGRIMHTFTGAPAGAGGLYSVRFGADTEFYNGLRIASQPFATVSLVPSVVGHLTQGTNYGSGIGIIQTVDSNNLLVIRVKDGGYVARGDVLDPSEVVHIRTLPPTFDTIARPVTIDRAVVYGSRTGVWRMPGGGDQAECISPQLDGWFWGTEEMDPVHPFFTLRGKFNHAPPFLLAPNNWVMDLRTGGWWRLEDPDVLPYAWYDISHNGRIYASPSWINSTRQTLNHQYDPTLGATSYSWRSQPINRTINRVVVCREVVMVAQGSGVVTVTLIGMDGTAEPVSMTVDSTQPVVRSLPINLKAHDVEVLIEAEGADASTAAPILHRLSIGYSVKETARAAA